MRISAKIKIGICLVIVFIAGGVCGAVGALRISERSFIKMLDSKNWSPAMMKGLNDDLHLTPEQQQKAKTMVDQAVEDVRYGFRQLGLTLVRLHWRIHEILTPEQQAKQEEGFSKLRREFAEKFKVTLPPDAEATNFPPHDMTVARTNTTSSSKSP